jgi:hypothetical protein
MFLYDGSEQSNDKSFQVAARFSKETWMDVCVISGLATCTPFIFGTLRYPMGIPLFGGIVKKGGYVSPNGNAVCVCCLCFRQTRYMQPSRLKYLKEDEKNVALI